MENQMYENQNIERPVPEIVNLLIRNKVDCF